MPSPAERENREHLERVHAVQRRSAYERVLDRIASYEAWERDADLGEEEQRQFAYLRELRESMRDEMIAAGQIEA